MLCDNCLKGREMALLNVDQVADRLNMARKTIYTKCAARQIPHYKIGGALRFDPKKIDEWLKSCRVQARTHKWRKI